MANKIYKLGELIEICDERNELGIRNFYGIDINKEFMPTFADTNGLDETKYKVVRKNRFVFSGMQTGRDECIRISMYQNDEPIIVSPAYTTFEIKATNIVLPTYFFMLFLSKEKDRYGAFCSDGSIRSNLDWEVFCDIEITLPSLEIQQKFVSIYEALLENLQSFRQGLDGLKLVCDGYIENLRKNLPCEKIGKYLRACNEKNENNEITLFQGVTVEHVFTDPKRIAENSENGSVVRKGQFAFNKVMKANGTKLPIALREDDDCVVSNSYQVFEISEKEKLNPKYLMLWFNRAETERYAGYISFGTTREIFSFDDLCEVSIPIPSIEIQKSIAEIYNAYTERKQIAERLNEQIKQICPVLIKGSLGEQNGL